MMWTTTTTLSPAAASSSPTSSPHPHFIATSKDQCFIPTITAFHPLPSSCRHQFICSVSSPQVSLLPSAPPPVVQTECCHCCSCVCHQRPLQALSPPVVTTKSTTTLANNPSWTSRIAQAPMESLFLPPQPVTRDDLDIHRIQTALNTLEVSGYYYGGITWQQADALLKHTEVGSFLVRDSSDNRFIFALSVQTERGPTSVRIYYSNGEFRLDSEIALAMHMPWFPCVVQLVQYYASLSASEKGKACVWLDGEGRRDLTIRLRKPLYRRVHSLKHLCRLSVNSDARQRTDNASRIPPSVKAYLTQYPYSH